MIRCFGLVLLWAALLGCTQAPTKIFETTPVQTKATAKNSWRPGTVIVDSRPDFEFAMTHVPGAISMHWQDFAQKEAPYLGELELDLFPAARRLARYGIRPGTPVLVLGKGLESLGEDQRLAWTFRVMGLSDVQVVNQKDFSVPRLNGEEPPPKSQSLWKPEIDEGLVVSREVFLRQMSKSPGLLRPLFLDVREKNSGLNNPLPIPGVLQIPWSQFFFEDGTVRAEMVSRLKAQGVEMDQALYVIDEMGVKSAAVTMALRFLGFSKAANFAGGYLELSK